MNFTKRSLKYIIVIVIEVLQTVISDGQSTCFNHIIKNLINQICCWDLELYIITCFIRYVVNLNNNMIHYLKMRSCNGSRKLKCLPFQNQRKYTSRFKFIPKGQISTINFRWNSVFEMEVTKTFTEFFRTK